ASSSSARRSCMPGCRPSASPMTTAPAASAETRSGNKRPAAGLADGEGLDKSDDPLPAPNVIAGLDPAIQGNSPILCSGGTIPKLEPPTWIAGSKPGDDNSVINPHCHMRKRQRHAVGCTF